MVATSPDTLPLDHVTTVLSECPTFISWTGAATSAEALTHIHRHQAPDGAARPYAMVGFSEGRTTRITGTGGARESEGSVLVTLEGDHLTTDTDAESVESLNNFSSQIMDGEFWAQSVVFGFYLIGVNRTDTPKLFAEEEEDDRGISGAVSYEVLYMD